MQLSVNLNKVALLRNSRGGTNPSPLVAAEACLDAGAHGLTLHWREDHRHARADDVRALAALCHARGREFNLEGDTREPLIALAIEVRATQLTLVPVTPGEVTSDHGWDFRADSERLRALIARVHAHGIRTSVFVDAIAENMPAAKATGADRVEIYTEPYARSFGTAVFEGMFAAVRDTASAATSLGLGVNAGHDLNLANLPRLAREVSEILEVSIGHAFIADALYLGLRETTQRYLAACRGESPTFPRTY